MKFSLLINMERFDTTKTHQQLLGEMIELVQIAERGGFDVAWFGEHHTIEFTISPNPLQLIAHLAPQTSTIRLGTAIVTAPYWNPIRLAGEAAMADVMTNGRLELGIARGAYQYEFDRMMDIPQSEGAKYMNELVPAIQGLWAGDYAHDGECYRFPNATSVPKPMQQPYPGLWIAARGLPSFEFAIENGCNVMGTPLSKPDAEVEDLARKFKETCAKFPNVSPRELMIARQTVVLGDNEDWRPTAEAFVEYGRKFENLFKNLGTVENGFPEPATREEIANRNEYDLETIRSNQMIGTPSEIIPRIQQYAEWGVDQYCFHIDGGMAHEDKRRSLQRFADEVIPAFRDEPISAVR